MIETDCRAYLLGQMDQADAERFEARLLDDQELFETLKSVEDDLIDEHARGGLPAAERERFAARYAGRTDRLAFAAALAERVATSARPARVLGFPIRYAVPLAAAASLLLAAGTTLMFWHATPRDTSIASPVQDQAETRVAAPIAVSVLVTLGSSRAAAPDATPVALPSGLATLALRVRLNPADRFDRYAMELRAPDGRVIWRGDDLRAAAEGGELTLSSSVPAEGLAGGRYELAVRGGTEDLGFVTLQVSRTP